MSNAEVFIQCLEHLYPCTGLLYVGAGHDVTLTDANLKPIPRLIAIEADDLAFSHLQRNLPAHPGWKAIKALVSETVQETSFHIASSPYENGLLHPDILQNTWRNLRCQEIRSEPATTLSAILAEEDAPQVFNWLRIDCLPGALIMRGLENHLDQFDVIDLRALIQTTGILNQGCDLAESNQMLEPLGYRAALIEECNNPSILRVLYIRDTKRYAQINVEQQTQRDSIEIQALNQTVDALRRATAQLEKEKADLAAARDSEHQRATQLAQEVAALNQIKTQLEKEKTDIAARHTEQAKLADERQKQLETLRLTIQKLQSDETEMNSRLHQIQQELLKAEVQLDVIKEFVLRESAL